MYPKVHEIAPDIFRLSTAVPEVAPGGFTFNQFLVRDAEPFLFHTGMRDLYPLVSAAVARSCRPTTCAGSPSPTSRPTSAAP